MLIITVACDDNNASSEDVQPIANVIYTQQPGGVLFKWDNPDTELSYVEILFKNDPAQENPQRIIVQSPLTEQLISGLPDAKEREFTFSAYLNGKASKPVIVVAKGSETPLNQLANTIQASVVPNGKKMRVSWDNQFEGQFVISMFIDAIKDKPDREIVINSKGADEQYIYMPDDLFSANAIFTLTDSYKNKYQLFTKNYISISEDGWLNRALWNIVGLSSEDPDWISTNILTGQGNGWASLLKPAEVYTFPQYLIFDLKREVELTKAHYMTANGYSLMTCKIQGSYSSNTNAEWTDIVSFKVTQHKANSWQEVEFPEPVKYRYIRFYCVSGPTWFAVMKQFGLYGRDIVDE